MNTDLRVDAVHYMGFQSYGVHPVATLKPGEKEYYVKDANKDISNTDKRKVDYFKDNNRYESTYVAEYINRLNNEDYKKGRDQELKKSLGKYEYSYDQNLVNMTLDKKYKDEDYVKSKFEETNKSEDRQKMFSNWNSVYQTANKVTEEAKKKYNFQKSKIDPLFMGRYHRYHVGSYKTEQLNSMGEPGDIPFEKFFLNNQRKLYSSNYQLSKGTPKSTEFIPGYGGFIPTNNFTIFHDLINDPYFACNKTNHWKNYKIRLPNYQGFVPTEAKNIKGNPRPFCLSTEGETFQ